MDDDGTSGNGMLQLRSGNAVRQTVLPIRPVTDYSIGGNASRHDYDQRAARIQAGYDNCGHATNPFSNVTLPAI